MTAPATDIEPTTAALQFYTEKAALLFGDIVLVPLDDGRPAFSMTRRDLDWPDISIPEADLSRLAILTDGFHKFSNDVPRLDGISVITWWDSSREPQVIQIEGAEAHADISTGIVRDALASDKPIKEIRRVLTAANENHGGSTRISIPILPQPLLPIINLSDWEGEDVPEREWYIDGLMPSRNVTMLSGDGGLGKSLAALQLGIAGALGRDTMGLTPKFGRCLYLGAEDEADEFHRRVHDILRHYHASYADLEGRFLLSPMAGMDATLARADKNRTMRATPLFESLCARAQEFGPDLIVLDTSADLFDGNEIDRTQVRQFVGMLRALAMENDCTVLLLSHPSVSGMQSGTGTSGSTAWNNSVRSRLYLTAATGEGADPDMRTISAMKSNYGKASGKLQVRWSQGVFIEHDGTKPTPTDGIMNKHADEVFLSLLSTFNRQGIPVGPSASVIYAPKVMAAHEGGKGITKKAFEHSMHRLLADGRIKIVVDGPPSKPRNRLWVTTEDFGPEKAEPV